MIFRGIGIWPEVQAAVARLVVDGPTPETLAAALSRLLTDKALRHEMGRKGCELVATAFNPGTVGRQLSELYRAAAEGPQRVPEVLS